MRYTVWRLTRPEDAMGTYTGTRQPFPAAYREVGRLTADSLDAAFVAGQNAFAPGRAWNPEHPCPSVSVGDMLVDADGRAFEVAPVGWIARAHLPPKAAV